MKRTQMKKAPGDSMRAYVYMRYSSAKQQELSIEGQRDVCLDYAAKHNIQVVEEYIDRAKTGTNDSREAFRRLIRDALAGDVDCVLVWKYDRFFRDRVESALYRRQLEDAGIRLISVTEFIPEGSAGIITQGMIETIAEYFSAKLSEDVSRGMYEAAQHCQITCAAPLGYRTGKDKRWEIDPVGAELVRRIYMSYDSGMPLKELAEQLNQEGRKTSQGKPFQKNSFNTILRNKKYIGIYEYNGLVSVSGGIPRILEDDLFFRVQRKLESNRHRPGAYKAKIDYLLSGKLFCGHCGAPMTAGAGTGKGGTTYHYYICNNRRVKKCSKKNVRQDLIEKAVLDTTLNALTDEVIAYVSVEVERRCAENSTAKDTIASLHTQIREAEKKIKNIGEAIANGIITPTTKQLLVDAETDRENLIAQLKKAETQLGLEIKAEAVACWLDSFRRGDRKNPEFQKQVFGALVHSVYVYDDHLKIIFNTQKDNIVTIPFSSIQAAKLEPLKCLNAVLLGVPDCTNINLAVFFLPGVFGICVPQYLY